MNSCLECGDLVSGPARLCPACVAAINAEALEPECDDRFRGEVLELRAMDRAQRLIDDERTRRASGDRSFE